MKRMKKLVGLIMLIGLYVNVWAYNPQITSYQINNINGAWSMEVSFPQVAIHTALIKKYGEQIVKGVTEKEYKEKLVAYMKANTTISFNNKTVDLGDAALRLGSHQTDMKFTLASPASKVKEMSFRLEALSENPGQQNVLRIFDGNKKNRFILSEANDYSVQIAFSETAISRIVPPLIKKDPFLLMIVVFGMCVMAILFWFKAFDGLNILRLSVAILLLLAIGFRYENDGSGPVFSSKASVSVADATAKDGNNKASLAIATAKTLQEKPHLHTAKKLVIIEK